MINAKDMFLRTGVSAGPDQGEVCLTGMQFSEMPFWILGDVFLRQVVAVHNVQQAGGLEGRWVRSAASGLNSAEFGLRPTTCRGGPAPLGGRSAGRFGAAQRPKVRPHVRFPANFLAGVRRRRMYTPSSGGYFPP